MDSHHFGHLRAGEGVPALAIDRYDDDRADLALRARYRERRPGV